MKKVINHIILAVSFLVVAASFSSCKKFLDVNKDPNNPTQLPAHSRLVGAITTTNGASMWRGTREMVGVMQYGATKLTSGTNRNAETWRFTASYFFWQNAYVFTMPNCVDLIVLGKKEQNYHLINTAPSWLAIIMMGSRRSNCCPKWTISKPLTNTSIHC